MEVIKQLFELTDFSEVKDSYRRIVIQELRYKGLSISPEEVLSDTINAAICIAGRGKPEEDYPLYIDGINRIRSHIIGEKFSGNIAGSYACRVLYLAASVLSDSEKVKKAEDLSVCPEIIPEIKDRRRFSYLRIVDPAAYGCLVESVSLLSRNKELDKRNYYL